MKHPTCRMSIFGVHRYELVGAYDADTGFYECRQCGHRRVRSIAAIIERTRRLLGK